jgi:Tfp pilus assembly protein PilO
MSETRLWKFGAIVLIIALVLGTWFLAISPRLDEASQANENRSAVEMQNLTHEATLAALEKDAKNFNKFEDELADLRVAVPSGAGLPLLIDQLNSLAAETGVVIEQLTASDPVAYVHPVAADGTSGVEEDTELVAARAGIAPERLLVVPIGLRVAGAYDNVMGFVDGLQHGDRIALVHGLNLTTGPATGTSQVVLEITAQTFVLLENPPTPAVTNEEPVSEGVAAG